MADIAWLRAVPPGGPADWLQHGRPFVVDDTPRAVVWDYDYRDALRQLDAGGVILDWDIAISPEQRSKLSDAISAQPEQVCVVPYRLYPRSTGLDQVVWSPRRAEGGGGWRWVTEADDVCDLFGFGCTYVPGWLARRSVAEIAGRISDWEISYLHWRIGAGPIPIRWDIAPVHIHY